MVENREYGSAFENPLEVERFRILSGDGLRYEIRAFLNMVNEKGCPGLELTSEDSITLADIMGRFMEMESRE